MAIANRLNKKMKRKKKAKICLPSQLHAAAVALPVTRCLATFFSTDDQIPWILKRDYLRKLIKSWFSWFNRRSISVSLTQISNEFISTREANSSYSPISRKHCPQHTTDVWRRAHERLISRKSGKKVSRFRKEII